ncbi:MAG: glycosyltransferase family 2 protein [Thermoanaerobaculia bacterium]
MSERFAVVIPALDAVQTVGAIVSDARKEVPRVIVVDDGSTDGTGDAARAAGAEVVRHERNRGKGAALKSGFLEALQQGVDAVITLDADAQHLPREIGRFIDAYEASGADLIIGSRAHLFAGMVGRRRAANRFSAWSISRASTVRVLDSQSGFRLYSARLLRQLTIRANGFDAESEVIVRAGRAGLGIREIPIDLGFVNGIATSHYRPVLDTLRIAWTVTRTVVAG